MTHSMTGFASQTGAEADWAWAWELRSVNGKGLDLRLRVPDWIPGLETALRARLQAAVARGNVSLGLRVTREGGAAGRVDRAAVSRALAQVAAVEEIAAAEGRVLAAVRATDVLALRAGTEALDETQEARLRDMLLGDFDHRLLPRFIDMRVTEGRALDAIMSARLADIAAQVDRAAAAAQARSATRGDALREAVARIAAEVDVAPDRLAQELALLAVKQDVTEEIDRLRTHVGAARALVAAAGPKGRKLDFLMQEFNREANTLCAKSQDGTLTAVGLDLKTAIDQLREQIQNVE